MNWIRLGAISAMLAVMLGAFGAHGLRDFASPGDLAAFETGARYHLFHALALVLLGLMAPSRTRDYAAFAFLAGTILFSGSLYVLGATATRAFVLITPIGGVAFIIGWLMLAISPPKAQSGDQNG